MNEYEEIKKLLKDFRMENDIEPFVDIDKWKESFMEMEDDKLGLLISNDETDYYGTLPLSELLYFLYIAKYFIKNSNQLKDGRLEVLFKNMQN